jgi:hypothetical protein
MLKAKAEITFTLEGRDYSGKIHLRPVFRFAEGLLFSGAITSGYDEYLHGKKYIVDINFFTIEHEAYEAVKPLLEPDMGLTIHEGKRIIGIAKLLDFEFRYA